MDDGSTDNTKELVDRCRKEVGFELRYVSQGNKGPGAARNLGMEEARGELFLFIDSDCEAREDWLVKIHEEYISRRFDAYGGPDASKEDFTSMQKAIDFSMTSFFTTGGIRGHANKPLVKFYPRSHNMGITRELYERVGGFGGLRHGQDIELSHRIIMSGANVAYIHDAVVYHRRRTSLRGFFRQVFNWGVARVNLWKVDSKLLKPLHTLPAVAVILATLGFVGWIFNPNIFNIPLVLILGLLVFFAVYGGVKHRSFKAGLWILSVVTIQVFGYGLGFLFALMRSLMKKESWVGFTGSYYR